MKKIFNPALFMIIITFAVIGASCDVLNNNGSTNPSDLIGSWQLYKQTGAQQDVCPDEVLKLQSDGTAKLKCPNQSEITRTYSATNGVLTYTETGVSFDFSVVTENGAIKLQLIGKNVERNLYYNKVTTVDYKNDEPNASGKNSTNNSSEK